MSHTPSLKRKTITQDDQVIDNGQQKTKKRKVSEILNDLNKPQLIKLGEVVRLKKRTLMKKPELVKVLRPFYKSDKNFHKALKRIRKDKIQQKEKQVENRQKAFENTKLLQYRILKTLKVGQVVEEEIPDYITDSFGGEGYRTTRYEKRIITAIDNGKIMCGISEDGKPRVYTWLPGNKRFHHKGLSRGDQTWDYEYCLVLPEIGEIEKKDKHQVPSLYNLCLKKILVNPTMAKVLDTMVLS